MAHQLDRFEARAVVFLSDSASNMPTMQIQFAASTVAITSAVNDGGVSTIDEVVLLTQQRVDVVRDHLRRRPTPPDPAAPARPARADRSDGAA